MLSHATHSPCRIGYEEGSVDGLGEGDSLGDGEGDGLGGGEGLGDSLGDGLGPGSVQIRTTDPFAACVFP